MNHQDIHFPLCKPAYLASIVVELGGDGGGGGGGGGGKGGWWGYAVIGTTHSSLDSNENC